MDRRRVIYWIAFLLGRVLRLTDAATVPTTAKKPRVYRKPGTENVEKRPGGRPLGAKNKVSLPLKEAILKAAELVGSDSKGKDGLEGYLVDMAKNNRKQFASLLGRVLPIQVANEDDVPFQHHVTVELIRPGDVKRSQ
jgi:hypothetical protein